MRRLFALGFLVAVCGLAALARADGEYVKEGGGVVVPLSSEEVTMLWETVDLEVERPHLLAADDKLRVTVTYRFKNETPRPVKVAMGFPIAWDTKNTYNQAKDRPSTVRRSAILEFITTIDGKPAPVRERAVGAGAHKLPPDKRFTQYQVWDVAFAPQQERTVVNRYLYDAHAGIYWDENEVVYILSTGRSWKGPIGRATIRLILHDRGCLHLPGGRGGCISGDAKALGDDPFQFDPSLPEVGPYDPQLKLIERAKLIQRPDGTLEARWDLQKFEPDLDVHVSYQTALAARLQILHLIEGIDLAKASRAVLQSARDELVALYGLRFEDAAPAARFSKRSYYVMDPTMTLERLRKLEPLLVKIEARLASVAAPAPAVSR